MSRFDRVRTLVMVLTTTVVLSGSLAFAQSPDQGQGNPAISKGDGSKRDGLGKYHRRHAGRLKAILQQLNLTDQQKTQVKQIWANHRESMTPIANQLRSKRQELRQSIQGATFDEALVTQKLTEMAGLKAKLVGERFKIRQETLSVLTPEQKAKLDQMREQFRSHHHESRSN